jgi:hypothetical protein
MLYAKLTKENQQMGKIKNQIKITAISIVVTSIIFISFGSAQERTVKVERSVKKNVVLHNPSQLSPTSGTIFNKFPRHTVLRWSKVDGAASYMVEVEYNDSKWEPSVLTSTGKATIYKFDFVGKQSGRWRVWAVGPDGNESKKSAWWGFKYTK